MKRNDKFQTLPPPASSPFLHGRGGFCVSENSSAWVKGWGSLCAHSQLGQEVADHSREIRGSATHSCWPALLDALGEAPQKESQGSTESQK